MLSRASLHHLTESECINFPQFADTRPNLRWQFVSKVETGCVRVMGRKQIGRRLYGFISDDYNGLQLCPFSKGPGLAFFAIYFKASRNGGNQGHLSLGWLMFQVRDG